MDLCQDQLRRLVLIASQQPLVKSDVRVQGRLIAQQHIEELQLRDVLAQHDQADRQRAGQDEPDRSPQKRPEGGGHQQGHFRHADTTAVESRFDNVADEQLDRQKQPEHKQWLNPPLKHRQAEDDRRQGRDPDADIGDVPEYRRQESP